MGFIDEEEQSRLVGADSASARTPIPLQMVSSDEFLPSAKTAKQDEVGRRLAQMADEISPRLGLSRRRFFQTASGMAAAFVAMNETYGGEVFAATPDEARSPDTAHARSDALKDQFIIDVHTHFVHEGFLGAAAAQLPFPWRRAVAQLGWNPEIGNNVSMEAVQFANYHKEIYFDSDTKIALISSAPGVSPTFTPLTNQQMAQARTLVNQRAGAQRMLSHAMFTPGAPGWLDDLDAAIALRPDSWKGYTIGSTGIDNGRMGKVWPWRMDGADAYKAYDKMVRSGITTVCVHKGLYPPSMERAFPNLRGFADVADVGQAAKDWPQLNFVIYHAGYRHTDDPANAMSDPEYALREFERTGRMSWVSDLADIPAQYGVSNVYADLGQVFALTMIAQPRVCVAMLGILVKGLGADRVCWGTDAVWTGSPQWQIEGLRRIEIPADMRRRHGFAPLGSATGRVKSAIFAENSARLYGIGAVTRAAVLNDNLAQAKAEYVRAGRDPSNLQYGFVAGPS